MVARKANAFLDLSGGSPKYFTDSLPRHLNGRLANKTGCSEAVPSVRAVGDCYDNALCESFFATLECELLDRRLQTHGEARRAVFEFIKE